MQAGQMTASSWQAKLPARLTSDLARPVFRATASVSGRASSSSGTVRNFRGAAINRNRTADSFRRGAGLPPAKSSTPIRRLPAAVARAALRWSPGSSVFAGTPRRGAAACGARGGGDATAPPGGEEELPAAGESADQRPPDGPRKWILCVAGLSALCLSVAVLGPKALAEATTASTLDCALKPSLMMMLTYQAQKVLMANLAVKLIAVGSVLIPLCLMGGLLYSFITGTPLGRSLFLAYSVVSDSPGADVVNEDSSGAGLLMASLFVVGLLTYAVVLGFVSDELTTKIDQFKNGNGPVLEQGHNVVLGWNKTAVPLLQQAAITRAELQGSTWSKPIVVMHEGATPEFRDELKETLGRINLDVITRQGNPHFLPDLLKAGTHNARTVVLLSPGQSNIAMEDEAAQFGQVATASALSVLTNGSNNKNQTWVIQAGAESWLGDVIRGAYGQGDGRKTLYFGRLTGRTGMLAAQCALQPGLSKVYSTLFQRNADAEVNILDMPSLKGKPHGVVRQLFPNEVVIGYCRYVPSGARGSQNVFHPLLNTGDDYIMQPDDRIIIICNNSSKLKMIDSSKVKYVPPQPISRLAEGGSETRDIVVIQPGQERLHGILKNLVTFGRPGTSVCVLDTEEPDGLQEYTDAGFNIRHVQGTILQREALLHAGISKCDTIILVNPMDEGADDKQQDAWALAALSVISHLREDQMAAEGLSEMRPVHVVATVQHRETTAALETIASRSKTPIMIDTLDLEEIAAGVLVQVAAQPAIGTVFQQLFSTTDGCELYVRKTDRYFPRGMEGEGVTFGDMEEKARLHGETAIGFITDCGKFQLAGSRGQVINLGRDSLIVVAQG